jgi:hypothetical protein
LNHVNYHPPPKKNKKIKKEKRQSQEEVAMTMKYLKTNRKKKSLKIPKGQSESVNRRRTDKTLVKRKMTKGQTTIYRF